MIKPGDHIIWHKFNPPGEPLIFTGHVRHVNDYGAHVIRWRKDSKGITQQYCEFYSFEELERCQVMGNGAVCE